MNILNVERDLEESLANLATTALPVALEGLRHLPVGDRNPQVSIRYQHNSRKVRADADASYFDPESCEVDQIRDRYGRRPARKRHTWFPRTR